MAWETPTVTEDEVRKVVAEMTTNPDPEREYELRHPDCVIDIPQSGERFAREGMREVQRNFPGGAPEMNVARLAGEGDVWVAGGASPRRIDEPVSRFEIAPHPL